MPIKVYDRGSYTLSKKAELDFEHQLAILTTSALMDKLPILRPYTIGFETVKKNEDGTEGIGLGIYMIGKQVIYIPSFYRKNTLKTGLFMILADSNTFRPATEEWISIIREQNEKTVGDIVDKNDVPEVRAGAPSAIRAREFLDPISKTAKKASSCEALWKHLCKSAEKAKALPGFSVLDVALELGKSASKRLIDTMANDTRFLNDMLKGYTPDQIDMFKTAALSLYPDMYHPVDRKAAPVQKFASLVVPFDKQAKKLSYAEQRQLQEDGFFIKTAADSKFSAVLDGTVENTEISTVGEDGIYKLLPNGADDFDVAVVLHPYEKDTYYPESYNGSNNFDRKGAYTFLRVSRNVAVITDKTGTDSFVPYNDELVGIRVSDTPQKFQKVLQSLGKPIEDVTKLDCQDILITPYGQVIYVPGYMSSIGTKDAPAFAEAGYDGCAMTVRVDNNIRKVYCDAKTMTVPAGTKVLSNISKKIGKDADEKYPDNWVKREEYRTKAQADIVKPYANAASLCKNTFHTLVKDYNRIRIKSDGRDFQISKDDGSGKNDFEGRTKEAALHLVETYHVSPNDALKMLRKFASSSNGYHEHHFYIQKQAYEYNMSDVYGYDRGSSPYDIPVEMSYTDRYEPGPQIDVISTEGRVFTAQSKEQLMDMIHQAAENGVKEVMDAAVVKMMINTSSPMNLVGDYMKAFLTALDKIGRTLFLVLAHEDTFEQQYGEEQINELIETLKSGMESMSDTVLFLRNKSLLSVDLTAAADQGANDLTTAITH